MIHSSRQGDGGGGRERHAELRELLALVADGEVDRATSDRLNALLADDAEARAIYLDYVSVDAMLRWTDNASAPAGEPTTVVADVDEAPFVEPTEEPGVLARLGGWRVAAAAALAIAGLVAVVAATWNDGVEPKPVVAAAPVAVLTDADDLVLLDGQDEPATIGAALRPGWVSVPSGVAEITFKSGATVRLIGPARLRLESKLAAELADGRLAAQIPPAAHGFTVGVNGWKVVDLGTAFGVALSPKGEPSVHVFDGRVRVDGGGMSEIIEAGDAVRLTAAGPAPTPLDRPAFGGMLLALSDADDRPKPPAAEQLALWLAADRSVERDAAGRVEVWRDANAFATGRALQSAPDMRPLWVSDSIHARPGIRFNGGQYMQLPRTDALGIAGNDYEVFIVARTDSPGVQFLLAGSRIDGSERFELHADGSAAVRFIPKRQTDYALHRPEDAYADVGASGGAIGAPHVFHARVTGDVGTVALDGVDGFDTVESEGLSAWTGELTLGIRGNAEYGWRGDISEVLIYAGALSAGQRDAVSRYLAERYGIELKTSDDGEPRPGSADGIGEASDADTP